MKNRVRHIGITDILLLIFAVLFLVGVRTVFASCGPNEEGGWMTCHWAGQAETGIGAVLSVIAVIHLCVKNAGIKTGLSAAMVPVAVLAALLPGNLVHLCMMNSMRCQAVMKPGVFVCSILIILTACADILIQRKQI